MTSSGDDAIEQAAERAKHTADKNIDNLPGLPIDDRTANLRQGPDLHEGLLALLPLVGVWRGEGEGIDPVTGTYRFGQQIVVSHDGANHLYWESRSWVLDDDGNYVKPDASETGFWRISETDEIELLLAHAEGWIELYYGRPLNQTSWNLTTDVVITTESGRKAGGAKRLYGLAPDGDLAFVEERVNPDGDLVPRASAKLARYAG